MCRDDRRSRFDDGHDSPGLVAELCGELDLIHVVDPLRRDPQGDAGAAYLRLHGLNEDEYDYRYDYSADELRELADRVEAIAEGRDVVYCLFNNDAKFENAAAFRRIVSD
ncbi:MAG: DUF72 domain-containing protein [Bradymonadaceae bacterium]